MLSPTRHSERSPRRHSERSEEFLFACNPHALAAPPKDVSLSLDMTKAETGSHPFSVIPAERSESRDRAKADLEAIPDTA